MALEIEVKAHAPAQLPELEEKLKAISGVVFKSEVETEDTYYAHPHKDFGETDEALRIRRESGKVFLTYKGPKLDAESKSREEFQAEVSDGEILSMILEKLGFSVFGRVGKRRKVYSLGPLEICLDDVYGLGQFLEVEYAEERIDPKIPISTYTAHIFEFLERLGASHFERQSYLELLQKSK